jgi:hypothetical protein
MALQVEAHSEARSPRGRPWCDASREAIVLDRYLLLTDNDERNADSRSRRTSPTAPAIGPLTSIGYSGRCRHAVGTRLAGRRFDHELSEHEIAIGVETRAVVRQTLVSERFYSKPRDVR